MIAALFIIVAIPYFFTSSTLSIMMALPFALVFLAAVAFSPCFASFEKLPPLEAWGKSFELIITDIEGAVSMLVIFGIISPILILIPIIGPVLFFLAVPWMSLAFVTLYKKE